MYNSPSLGHVSLQISVTSGAVKRCRLWATGIIHAFTQSFRLPREIYIIFSQNFALYDHECCRLVKPLYTVFDAGGYWYIKHRSFMSEAFRFANLD